jgi:hypothetical protein
MRTYFFGDLHGNAYALEACLAHLEAQKPDAAVCLGDLAGWLPFGDRTLLRTRERGFPAVAGNHDLLIAGAFVDHPAQIDRMQATAYNAGLIFPIPGTVDYLLGLPLAIEGEGYIAVHHSPFDLPAPGLAPTIETFNYLDEPALEDALPAWQNYPGRLIVSGHDHVPAVFELPDGIEDPKLKDVKVHRPPEDGPLTVELQPDSRYWVKAGSVGGPYRDQVPVANSVVYDSEAGTVTLFRIPFDLEKLHAELSGHRFCRNLPTIRRYLCLMENRIAAR